MNTGGNNLNMPPEPEKPKFWFLIYFRDIFDNNQNHTSELFKNQKTKLKTDIEVEVMIDTDDPQTAIKKARELKKLDENRFSLIEIEKIIPQSKENGERHFYQGIEHLKPKDK